MLKENFLSDFDKLINVAWAEDGEKKLVKILAVNRANIKKDETKGKEFITNLVNTNKSFITNSCSEEFVNTINVLIGNNENAIAESKLINNMNILIDSIQKKPNKMYKYYQVNYLNESKYVAVPLFAVNQLTEHTDVLKYALESKQLKTSKGVDYVVEVSEQEFEEVMPDTEESFGKEPKEEKPQDAGIDAAKNKFDTVKQEKGGAQQTDGKKLHESLMSLFEGEDNETEDFDTEEAAYYQRLYNGEKQAGLHGSNEDYLEGIDDGLQRSKTSQMMEMEAAGATEFEEYMNEGEELEEGCLDESSAAWDKATGKNHKARFTEDEEVKYAETLGETDATKHMTRMQESKRSLKEGVFGSVKCPKCECENCYKIAGDYSECPDCHNHWKPMNENDTSDMQVPSESAISGNKQAARKVNPFGEKADSEYMSDEEILQEAFIKFVLRNSQGAKAFLKEGKFQLKAFLDSKSYDMLTILENEFRASLEEADAENFLDVNDITFEGGNVSIDYFYPSQEGTTNITVEEEEFFDYLEGQDPNWEDYQDAQGYWDSLNWKEQMEVARLFLIGKKGVSKIL